ncbi:MAG: radical SAM protein [Candidatus Cloacimonetes bacterium]|nr:radical SAM protein [Candidatus Cloacimonadota bacterium]
MPVLHNGPGKRLEYRINFWSEQAKELYGKKIYRVAVSLNTPCPNRTHGGCNFCLQDSFAPEFRGIPIGEQLRLSIAKIAKNAPEEHGFIAYFQDETIGASDYSTLDKAIKEALSIPKVLGIIVSTRPDHCDDDFLRIIKKHNAYLELGMQTIHPQSLLFLNRNHTHEHTVDALQRIDKHGLKTGVHLIIGIPGESIGDMLETIQFVNRNSVITDVKFHNLVAFENTPISRLNNHLPDIDEYIETLLVLLPQLTNRVTISRLFTSNILKSEIALNITGEKKVWLNKLLKRIYETGVFQGGKNLV